MILFFCIVTNTPLYIEYIFFILILMATWASSVTSFCE